MGGILDSLTNGAWGNYFGNMANNMSPALQENSFRQQGANTIDQQLGPGMGALMMASPAAAQATIGQRNLQITHDALIGQRGPDGKPISDQQAWILALHPEIISEQGKPINVPPGGSVYTPLFGGGGQGGAPNSQQQQPPSSQPGPSNASVGGNSPAGMPGAQFTNQGGIMQQPALLNLVRQALLGKDVQSQLGGGMSGMGGINRAAFQNLMDQVMPNPRAFGIDTDPVTPEALVSRQAKFPAYEKASEKNADISSSMQLAQTEALGILPYLKQAAAKLGPGQIPAWNAVKQEFQAQTGNPATAELASYMNAMINTYSRGISSRGQGPTVYDKNHLAEVISKFWSAGQWEAGTKAIINELGVANDAIHKNQNRIDVQYGFGKKAAPADEASARAALAKGADKQEVIRRFEEGGFNAPQF